VDVLLVQREVSGEEAVRGGVSSAGISGQRPHLLLQLRLQARVEVTLERVGKFAVGRSLCTSNLLKYFNVSQYGHFTWKV